MEPENQQDLDLFGNPWRSPKDRRGRKGHKWSAYIAENIGVLRAAGFTHEEIAGRFGLDPKTLRKYYSRELGDGASLAQAKIDEVIYQKALAGNVSAARYCRERFDSGKAKRVASAPAPVQPPRLGKKEQAKVDAMGVTGRFATPEAPKLVVDNG